MQNICWTSVVHSLTNCGAYIVKIKDVQSSVQHSIDQGSLQKVVNTSLEIFSPKKIADSAFSCGLPFVLPSFIKKRSEFEMKFFSLKTVRILDSLQKFDFFFLLHFSVHWAVHFNNLTTEWNFQIFQDIGESKASQ